MKHSFPPIEGIIYYAINKSENSASRMKEIFLLALELKIDFDTADVNKKGNYLCYDKNDNQITRITRLTDDDTVVITEAEFMKALKGEKVTFNLPFKKSVQLNESYEAIVTKDKIKVGCQYFTHDKLEELYKASKEAQKSLK